MSWHAAIERRLVSIREQHRWRECVEFDVTGVRGTLHGRPVVCFASNDYFGLSQHPSLKRAAQDAVERFGTGAGSARLVVGTRSLHAQLEAAIAQWKHCEDALVFPAGFMANLAVLSALGTADVTIYSDALNHASIIDGCRLAQAQVEIYRHCDVAHLESLVRRSSARPLIVTDAVFSMDGDVAPLSDLARLAARHDALLVLDEAHVLPGTDCDDLPCEVLRVGTLSKTLGSQGGWVAGSRAMIQLLTNVARAFVYTTGLSPADAAAALAAVELVQNEEGAQLRHTLQGHIQTLRPQHATPIVPVVLGGDELALSAARQLFELGFHVPAIRPPTVPAGSARLRVSLSSLHTFAEVLRLKHALTGMGTA